MFHANWRGRGSRFEEHITLEILKQFSNASQPSLRALCRELLRRSKLHHCYSERFRSYFSALVRFDSEISEECHRIVASPDAVHNSAKQERMEEKDDGDCTFAATSTSRLGETARRELLSIGGAESELGAANPINDDILKSTDLNVQAVQPIADKTLYKRNFSNFRLLDDQPTRHEQGIDAPMNRYTRISDERIKSEYDDGDRKSRKDHFEDIVDLQGDRKKKVLTMRVKINMMTVTISQNVQYDGPGHSESHQKGENGSCAGSDLEEGEERINDETSEDEHDDGDREAQNVQYDGPGHSESHQKGENGSCAGSDLEEGEERINDETSEDEHDDGDREAQNDQYDDQGDPGSDRMGENGSCAGSDLEEGEERINDETSEDEHDDGDREAQNDQYDDQGDPGSDRMGENGSCAGSDLEEGEERINDETSEDEHDDGDREAQNVQYDGPGHSESHQKGENGSCAGSDLEEGEERINDETSEDEHDDGDREAQNDQYDDQGDPGSDRMGENGSCAGSDLEEGEERINDETSEDEHDDGDREAQNDQYDDQGDPVSHRSDTLGSHIGNTNERKSKLSVARKPISNRSDYNLDYNRVITGQAYTDAINTDWETEFPPINSAKYAYSMTEKGKGSDDATATICPRSSKDKVQVLSTDDTAPCSGWAVPSSGSNKMPKLISCIDVSNKELHSAILDGEVVCDRNQGDDQLLSHYLSTKTCDKYSLKLELIIGNASGKLTKNKEQIWNFINNSVSPHLEALYPSCVIKLSNYRNNQKKKKISPRFSIIGKCVCESCPLVFKVVMMELREVGDQKVYLLQGSTPLDPHPECNLRSKYSRKKLGHEVIRCGASSVYYNLIGETPLDKLKTGDHKVPTLQNLRQIAQRLRNEDKYDSDRDKSVRLIAEVLKKVDVENMVLPGYVQADNFVAGSTILFTEDQLRELARCKDDITLHIDATGSIIKKVKNTKPFLYHAVVFNRGTCTPPLPAIEMLSRENTSTQVTEMLTHLRNDYRKVNNKELKVKNIVTDQSWPNINSILTAFQLGSIEGYLDLLWHTEPSQYSGTIIKLCYAHLMKNVSSKAKKYLPAATSKQRFVLLVIFSRMADCTSRNEFDEQFKLFAKILLSPSLSSETFDSIASLTENKVESDYDSSTEQVEDVAYKSNENRTRIRDRCAVGRHFDDMSKVIRENIDDAENSERNYLYSPALLDNFLTNVLPFAPLWSSLHGKRKMNAMVENHHKIIKHDVLKERVDIGTFLTSMYRNIKQRAREYAADFAPRKQKVKSQSKSQFVKDAEERWFKKGRRNSNINQRLINKLNEETQGKTSPGDTDSHCRQNSARIDGDRQDERTATIVNPTEYLEVNRKFQNISIRKSEKTSSSKATSMADSLKLKTDTEKKEQESNCKQIEARTEIPKPSTIICHTKSDAVDDTPSIGNDVYFDEICKPNQWSQSLLFQKDINSTVGHSRDDVNLSDMQMQSATRSDVRTLDMTASGSRQLLLIDGMTKMHERKHNSINNTDVSVQDCNWVSVDGIRLTIRNKVNILSALGWISSDEIDAFLCLIDQSNIKRDPETEMPMCLTVRAPKPLQSPSHKFIQIINTQYTQASKRKNNCSLGSHWVVLSNTLTDPCSDCGTIANVAYFCSLGCKPTPDIKRYLFNKYHVISKLKYIKIHIHEIQKQPDGSSCGVFALANATALAENYEPSLIEYDIDLMRSHTANCLEEYLVSFFPTKQLGIDVNLVNKQIQGLYGPKIREVVVIETGRQ